ncbi:biopolymer transporter ExbD [Rhodobacteraceae bacterium 63075]|nr:biopolymer transporter ExbD [Rhodobacteraceae bacterium 63075]
MDFSEPKPRRQSEPALPMINVVFLLLVFFLMSAQIVAPPPLDVRPPVAERGAAPEGDLRLHISAEGEIALGELRGSAVWDRLSERPDADQTTVLIRADGALPAAELAAVIARISALGFARVQLATEPE